MNNFMINNIDIYMQNRKFLFPKEISNIKPKNS